MVVNVKLYKPHSKQQLFLDSKTRFKVIMAGRRFGKSLIVQNKSIEYMLDGKYVAYVTPTYSLAKVFFTEVVKLLPAEIVVSANKTDLIIELITGGTLTFFTGEKPDAFRGRKFHLLIIDEASYVKDLKGSWENSYRPTLTDFIGEAIFISTPRGRDYFNSLYLRGLEASETDWESFHFTSYDNPYIDPKEIDMAKMELPEAAFRQEYLAIPSENISNPFGTANIAKNIIPKLSDKPSIVFGIDLAKTTDYTVIIGLDASGNMSYYDRFQLDWGTTKERIKALPRTVNKLIDSTGVGDVIVEELQNSITNVIGYKFTSSSKPQLILSLIKGVELSELGYLEDVAEEMNVFEYKITSTGHIKYEAMTGFNDDKVIALALAYWQFKRVSVNHNGWKGISVV